VQIPAYILDALYMPKKRWKSQLHTNSYWCPFESIRYFCFSINISFSAKFNYKQHW